MSFGFNEEQLQAIEQSQRALEQRYDSVNLAYTRILQGGGVDHYVGTLQPVLLPDEFQQLQRLSKDSVQVRELLWSMLMEMTEDA